MFWKTLSAALLAAAVLAPATPAFAQQNDQPLTPWPAKVDGFKPPAPGEHPRLFFRKSDIPTLRQRANTPEGKVIVQRLRTLLNGSDGQSLPAIVNASEKAYAGNKAAAAKSADDLINDDNVKTPTPEAKKGELPPGSYTLWHGAGYGMLYQLTGEQKYADLGAKAVEMALNGQRDRDDRYSFRKPGGALRAGPSVGAIAMAYDLCYDGWKPDFRQKVAQELLNYNEGQWMSLEQLALGKRHGPHSNHWGPQIGGGALALLAIKGDPGSDDAKVNKLLEANAKTMVRHMTEGFGDGGYFQEHAGPGQIASDTAFIPAVQAWKTAGGLDFINPRPHISAVTLVRCYELLPAGNGKSTYMLRHPSSYGSGKFPDDRNGLSRGGQFAQGFGAIKDQYRPGVLWVYNNFVEPEPAKRTFDTVSPYPHRAVLALVNWPINEKEENPANAFPKVHYDSLKYYVVFRNQWKDGNDILVSGLYGARNDGIEPVMIWGLGEKMTWGQCPKARNSTLNLVGADGSGVITASGGGKGANASASLAVDFSKKSGADAVIVMIGPGAGGALKGGGNKAKTSTATAGGTTFHVLTLSSNGDHPAPESDGQSIAVGAQTFTVKDGAIVIGK